MSRGKFYDKITTSSTSNIVNTKTTISVSIKPPSPVKNGDKLFISIPSEITPPTKTTLTCRGLDSLKSV